MSLLLDTNVVSEWIKPTPDFRFVRWIGSIDSRKAYLSVVTLAEVQHGIERLSAGQRRERLFAWMTQDLIGVFTDRIIDIDRAIAAEWARLVARCDSVGRPIGTMDGFLAATATVRGFTLVTRNASDFVATGVTVLNPWSE